MVQKDQIAPKPFSFWKIWKSSQSRSRVMRMRHFWVQNGPLVLNKIFLIQTIINTFIYLWVLFIVQNLKTKSFSGSRVMRIHYFWALTGLFALNKKFFWKNYHFYLAINPFHYAKFYENSYRGSRVMRMHHYWAQNGPFAQMRILS